MDCRLQKGDRESEALWGEGFRWVERVGSAVADLFEWGHFANKARNCLRNYEPFL
ncbi:hypothetical protein GCM10008018_43660 [Paenibacillus marchantiophytorum]|uniref:Uncharacterized protein n=1 Tax=Paenibacillus marchantiophytorum TaxID=1619310 RepID=A0ABQ1EZ54_9BACL|nr:hypothetical protein GCM10008018_43660 [Paenibacillus marchantiophytorum]